MKNNRLSGVSSLGYMGTNAQMPPNMFMFERAPTSNDYLNFSIGDFWIHRKSSTTNDSDLYVLLGVAQGTADWDLLSSNSGAVTSLSGDDAVKVLPSGGNINVLSNGTAGGTINFTGAGATLALGVADSDGNLALGNASGSSLVSPGEFNTIIGNSAGTSITTGDRSTIIGYLAQGSPTGSRNICIGQSAGGQLTTNDSDNVLIKNSGMPGDNLTIRIGSSLLGASATFIQGIRGVTTGVADAIAVLIDSSHQLGTASSSARYKQDIRSLGDASEVIYNLEPRFFHYKKHPEVPAWGLIAEEVDKVFPQLCVYNEEGQPESVKYHELSVLLLNELKKLNKRVQELENLLADKEK